MDLFALLAPKRCLASAGGTFRKVPGGVEGSMGLDCRVHRSRPREYGSAGHYRDAAALSQVLVAACVGGTSHRYYSRPPDIGRCLERLGQRGATGAVTAFVACRLWPRGGRAYVASVLFPVGVALIGTIVLNRYDVAVALLVAIFILCLCARWYTAAGFVIGMGFALKITPLALLPLVLLLAGPPRRWAWPLVAFGAAAVSPFLPYVLKSWSSVWYVFQYHLERPLQIESVLGTPQLLGELLGADWASWAWSHGSHSLIAPGVGLAADMSGGLTLLAVAAVYLFVWLRRHRLRAAPADQALVVLALLLALMTFGKVLSPQYFIWILPAWALVAARDRWIAVLGGLTLALTQAEFPALYWNLLDMEPAPLAIVVSRNTLLLATFVVTLWRVWRLPESAPERESPTRNPADATKRPSPQTP